MRSRSGFICGPFFGIFCGLGQGSFAIHFRGHLRHCLGSLILRSRSGIICGPFWASLAVSVGDYLRSILGITSGLGRGLFAVHIWDHLRTRSGIICGPFWASLAVSVGDYLRSILGITCGLGRGSFAVHIGDHLRSRSGIIFGTVQFFFFIV